MLPIKRLFQLIIIILTVSVAFLLFNISSNLIKSEDENRYASIELHLEERDLPKDFVQERCLIVGVPQDDTERSIYNNIVMTLSHMKIPYKLLNKITASELTGDPTVVFVVSKISTCASLTLVGDYISEGGKVLFAAGIPESYQDSYLNPVWGIIEKGIKVAENRFHIMPNFLPYDEVYVDYAGYNASTSIRITDKAQVFVESVDGIPIIYSNRYDKGEAVVINGTILEDKDAGGLFVAALCELQDQMIYPIIGSKVVFLDGFPPINDLNDSNTFRLYGRSEESFLRDILWPDLLSYATRYELKYTANILGIIPDNYDIELINERMLTYLFKEIIKYSGEIGIAGDHSSIYNFDREQVKTLYRYLKNDFPNYEFSAYTVMYGKVENDDLEALRDIFEGFDVVRGFYSGDPKTQTLQNFGEEETFITFPTVSSGYTKENGTFFDFLSGVSEYGVISHSFKISELISATSREDGWDSLKEEYHDLNQSMFGKTPWLYSATLSEAASRTKAYNRLEMCAVDVENGMQVYCNNFMEGQKFFIKSDREVRKVVNGSFNKINDVYYVITAFEPDFTVLYM